MKTKLVNNILSVQINKQIINDLVNHHWYIAWDNDMNRVEKIFSNKNNGFSIITYDYGKAIGNSPLNKYGESKLQQDQIVRNYLKNNENRVPIIGLRYSNVYGNGESHKGNMSSMIYRINQQIKNKELIKLFEYGEQKRDFIYVDDIVGYNVSSAFSNKSGIFNAGYGNSYSFNDVMRFFEIYYNSSIKVEFINNPYNFFQNHTLCDIDETLYKPIFDLKNGINQTLKML